MKKTLVNRLSVIMALAVLMIAAWCMASNAEVHAAVDVSAPRTYDSVAIWDSVYFGTYAQSDTSGRYKDPIQWRVLAVDDQKIMLIADLKLDKYQYYGSRKQMSWSQSILRTWLNGSFISGAFTSSEKADIMYVNSDYVSIPTKSDICNPSYGFISNVTRVTYNSDYCHKKLVAAMSDLSASQHSGAFWLREPSSATGQAAMVRGDGAIDTSTYYVDSQSVGVRPIIYVRRNSTNLRYAGKICSNGVTKPSTPANLQLTRKNFNQVEVSWDRCPDADGYKVYRLVEGSYVMKKTIDSRDTISWTETGLALNKTYTYKVKAYWNTDTSTLEGDSSEEMSVTVPKLKAPGNFKVVKASGKKAKASWSSTTGATGYQVYFKAKYKKSGKIKYITKYVSTKNLHTSAGYSASGCKVLGYSVKVRAYRIINSKRSYGPWTTLKSVKY